jgi:hypothetical protein
VSTTLWTPISFSFIAVVVPSGNISRLLYTVPNGTYARLKFYSVQVNANAGAANTIQTFLDVTINTVLLRVLFYVNPAVIASTYFDRQDCDILLSEGDTVDYRTINGSAVNVTYALSFMVEERQ